MKRKLLSLLLACSMALTWPPAAARSHLYRIPPRRIPYLLR